jgi:hypothetical protein
MIVIQNALIDAAQDKVIFSAKYSIGRVSLSLIICCLFVYLWSDNTYNIDYDIYYGIVVGGQGPLHFLLLGSIILLLLTPLVPLAFNPLCFKEIIFYPNRVEILRRIFRSKTIYYSNGMVERGYLLPGYLIDKVREKGQPQPTRFLYDFDLWFLPSEAARKIETILDYLTNDSSKKNPRVFRRSVLPGAAGKTTKQPDAVVK